MSSINGKEQDGFINRIRSNQTARRLQRLWVRNRDVTIAEGIGTGLRFNSANSNPEYGLGLNEMPVQEAFGRYLHEGGVFYDVGANVGFFTVIGARLVGPAGQVHAFEPVPENAAAVQHNCDLNGMKQVTVWETAVSDTNGTGELQLAHHSGGASLSVAAPPPDYKGTISINLITLDDFVGQQRGAPPSFVKIDVEGAEINVLRGMTHTIQTYKPTLIIEIDDGEPAEFQRKKELCITFLAELGYKIEMLPDSYARGNWSVENFVALPA